VPTSASLIRGVLFTPLPGDGGMLGWLLVELIARPPGTAPIYLSVSRVAGELIVDAPVTLGSYLGASGGGGGITFLSVSALLAFLADAGERLRAQHPELCPPGADRC
jgi:hypothetical protein